MNYKQSDCPSLCVRLIKIDYVKVDQSLGLERRILYQQKWNFMKNELREDNPNLAYLPY